MRNDSIETLLLRHYGSTAPAPVNLEHQLSAMVHKEVTAEGTRQQAVSRWTERRVSRRRVLKLVTFSSAGLSVLALGVNTFTNKPTQHSAYAL